MNNHIMIIVAHPVYFNSNPNEINWFCYWPWMHSLCFELAKTEVLYCCCHCHSKLYNFLFSPELLGHFQPNFAKNIHE